MQSLKVNKRNLSDELIAWLLETFGPAATDANAIAVLTDAVQKLKSDKQDKNLMPTYFNKNTDKVSENLLDSSLSTKINDAMNKDIGYNNLNKDLQNRIYNYENNALQAIGKANNLEVSVNSLNVAKSNIQNDINNLYDIVTRLNAGTGGSGGSSSADITQFRNTINTILSDLDSLSSQVTYLNNDNTTLNNSLSSKANKAEMLQMRDDLEESIYNLSTTKGLAINKGVSGETLGLTYGSQGMMAYTFPHVFEGRYMDPIDLNGKTDSYITDGRTVYIRKDIYENNDYFLSKQLTPVSGGQYYPLGAGDQFFLHRLFFDTSTHTPYIFSETNWKKLIPASEYEFTFNS